MSEGESERNVVRESDRQTEEEREKTERERKSCSEQWTV